MTTGAYATSTPDAVKATLTHLRRCVAAQPARVAWRADPRNRGIQPPWDPYRTDAAWLVTMAINRKAGWPDDPSLAVGSAMPVNGVYPKRAEGDCGEYQDSKRLAYRVNTPRLRVYARECPIRYRARLAYRLTWPHEEE